MKKKISFENLAEIEIRETGLIEAEVERQRSRFGLNEIVDRVGNFWIELFIETCKDPMIWFLFGIGIIFILVGEKQEAIILLLAILPLLFMDAFLHWRTQASTATLKGQLTSEAIVIRSGKQIMIRSHDIVPGDIVVLSTQQQYLPADGVWEFCEGVQVDESMLTGESFPIVKQSLGFNVVGAIEKGETFINSDNFGFAGTRLLTGQGRLRVLYTGRNTAYGEIVQSVSSVTHGRTPLQIAISKLERVLIYTAAGFCLILAGIRYYQGHGWLDALLSAATLAVAAIPEEFPVVFTFFLGVGVYRLAKRHALVQRAVSVENIGRINQICTDKTGTITVGQLKLTHVDCASDTNNIEVINCAISASDSAGSDPVDMAIYEYAKALSLNAPHRTHVFPFTEDRKRESAFISTDKKTICYTKGSPEVILSKSIVSETERNFWISKIKNWAIEGHKVLACAWQDVSDEDIKNLREPESGFHFSGLLAFEDPPRPEVREAMVYCQQNNIHVLMVTGDHPETALAIAKDVGLGGEHPVVISAEEFSEKFEEDFLNKDSTFLRKLDVVARCNPLQKFRVVKALRKLGNLVAVTGDGVNDVPALKAADIGIAMGIRGTKSAKEVSSIVLADDNFRTIINAIMEGRQLYFNLKMSFEYLLLFHIPFVITAAVIPLMGYPLLYLPAHIVWLELIIHPSALFAFQQRATNKIGSSAQREVSFFSKREIIQIFLAGLIVSIVLVFIYITGLREELEVGYARAKVLAFLSLWSAGLVLILTKGKSFAAKVTLVVTILFAIFLIQVPIISQSLHLTTLGIQDWGQIVLVEIILLILCNYQKSAL